MGENRPSNRIRAETGTISLALVCKEDGGRMEMTALVWKRQDDSRDQAAGRGERQVVDQGYIFGNIRCTELEA